MGSEPSGVLDLAAILASVPAALLILEPDDYRILAVTDAYLGATMTRREEIVGRKLFDAFPDNPDDAAANGTANLGASLQRARATRRPDAMPIQRYDIRRPAEEGGGFEERFWSPVNTPVLAADGSVRYLIHRVEDVTEFVRLRDKGDALSEARDELIQRAGTLEREIERRDAELEGWRRAHDQLVSAEAASRRSQEREQQLQHAQKLESLGVLAGGIAHDFNNLLVSVLGNAEIAAMQVGDDSPALRSLEDIQQAAQRAADLTRQLLAYAGRGTFDVQSIDVSELVEEMAGLLEVSVSKRAQVQYAFVAGLPRVEGDATQLRQVVMNLITNASDAIGDRNGIVSVSTGRTTVDREYLASAYLDDDLAEGEYVHIEVSDTGVGMDEATRARMFDPFFTTKFTGRGLGMAAVLGIIRGHRGAIKVYSELGKGTSVKILLPVQAAAAVQSPAEPAPLSIDRLGTVLVIDDDDAVRQVTTRILEMADFRVLSASGGEAALREYESAGADIDVVILDLTMPGMDGAETFAMLRRMNPDIRVILTSGYHEQEAMARFAGKGLVGFLRKPFRREELMTLLRGAFESRPG